MMTTEQRVKITIGEMVVQIAALQTSLEEAQAKIAEIEAKLATQDRSEK